MRMGCVHPLCPRDFPPASGYLLVVGDIQHNTSLLSAVYGSIILLLIELCQESLFILAGSALPLRKTPIKRALNSPPLKFNLKIAPLQAKETSHESRLKLSDTFFFLKPDCHHIQGRMAKLKTSESQFIWSNRWRPVMGQLRLDPSSDFVVPFHPKMGIFLLKSDGISVCYLIIFTIIIITILIFIIMI